MSTEHPLHTLDGLAHALRGMPRDARIVIQMPDGTLRPIALVRPHQGRPSTVDENSGKPGYTVVFVPAGKPAAETQG